jgi:hypothetical protein
MILVRYSDRGCFQSRDLKSIDSFVNKRESTNERISSKIEIGEPSERKESGRKRVSQAIRPKSQNIYNS